MMSWIPKKSVFTTYVISNIKKERYDPRYKFIGNEKSLVMEKYVTDFQQLPLNLVYSFDDPDDQVAMLNKFIKTVLTFMYR